MKIIQHTAVFGDETKQVKLTAPTGAEGEWQVFIENYYQGIVVKRSGIWYGYFNTASTLTQDDAGILGEMIDNFSGNP